MSKVSLRLPGLEEVIGFPYDILGDLLCTPPIIRNLGKCVVVEEDYTVENGILGAVRRQLLSLIYSPVGKTRVRS